ncbi:MAG: prolipoprotein diacylglyceryl transferase, partial [Lachnospiraceae bacterium]|nr:prolipoprotein diacylglyceryl transferase [Lachnospiraceae bacterium]
FGVIGARIYYVIFQFDYYRNNLISIFNLRQGGLAIYGGIIGGVLTILIFSRLHGMKVARVLDTVSMGVLIGQILGRWGNFFNREAFGGYTDGLLAMQLPVSAVRSGEITQQMMENLVETGSVTYVQVHPTFLYESLWNLGVLAIVYLTRNKTKFEGELFVRYLIGYGIGRF